MKILITSSRMPHALDEIRKFGMEGHDVFAADTFRTSPGNHSKYVRKAILTPSPTFDSARYITALEAIVAKHQIDVIVPGFEEVFRIAKHIDRFEHGVRVFAPPFETAARLHHKYRFVELARELELETPDTLLATSKVALQDAMKHFSEYIARPAYSRGGVDLLTNVGPRAGELPSDECRPTAERPWIVQRYVAGHDVCSFSVAHHGRIVAHMAYVHPKMIEHSGGILFESVDEPEALRVAQRVVSKLAYHGQISFDFIRSKNGLVLVECNPRPTAGVYMMESKPFVDAVLAPKSGSTYVVPPGVRAQIATAIVRDMFRDWHAIPSDLRALFSGARDVYARRGDLAPGVYQLLSYSHVFAFRRRLHVARHKHSDLVAAQFFDIAWDGEPIE